MKPRASGTSNFTLQRTAGSRCSPPSAERGVRLRGRDQWEVDPIRKRGEHKFEGPEAG